MILIFKYFFKYFERILRLWIFWIWFAVLDLLGLIVDTFLPEFMAPQWLYLVIGVVGFFVANIKLYADQEERLNLYESENALLQLTLEQHEFSPSHSGVRPPFEVNRNTETYGFDQDGMPAWVSLWARIVVNNLGWESNNRLEWELDKTKTQLPKLFLIEEGEEGEFRGTLNNVERTIDGRKLDWHLYLRIAQDYDTPEAFARALPMLDSYSIVLRYWTKRYDGASPPQYLEVNGNFSAFRQKIVEHWAGFGHSKLLKIADSPS